jgi:archaellin
MEGNASRAGGDRGIATAAAIVFLGLFLLLAVIVAGFYVITTGDSTAADPTELDLSTIRCSVGTYQGQTGIESVRFTIRYRGSANVDLSDAEVVYTEDGTETTFSFGENQSSDTIPIWNTSGAYHTNISAGDDHRFTIPIVRARGGTLPADRTATVELIVDGTTISEDIRTPGAIGDDTTYVDC